MTRDTLNSIGLDANGSKKLADLLNDLLANYSIFYQNTRGYHWNIRGNNFFELHEKFEQLYNELFEKIDEVAERILTLGYSPGHKFTDYLAVSGIEESNHLSKGMTAIEEILAAFQVLLTKQRNILQLAAEMNDEGTSALMSDYIRAQEKLVWMYSAYLNHE
ncbi:MAG: DNA starvation/stationary phase protection protein [Bacteroidota bacterium]